MSRRIRPVLPPPRIISIRRNPPPPLFCIHPLLQADHTNPRLTLPHWSSSLETPLSRGAYKMRLIVAGMVLQSSSPPKLFPTPPPPFSSQNTQTPPGGRGLSPDPRGPGVCARRPAGPLGPGHQEGPHLQDGRLHGQRHLAQRPLTRGADGAGAPFPCPGWGVTGSKAPGRPPPFAV